MPTHHNHIFQTDAPVPGCPGCSLIRPEVMHKAAYPYLVSGVFGPAPTLPEESPR